MQTLSPRERRQQKTRQAILDAAERRVEMLLRDGRTEPLDTSRNNNE